MALPVLQAAPQVLPGVPFRGHLTVGGERRHDPGVPVQAAQVPEVARAQALADQASRV